MFLQKAKHEMSSEKDSKLAMFLENCTEEKKSSKQTSYERCRREKLTSDISD